jgi:transcriptional regulator with XRE-family HTH domain
MKTRDTLAANMRRLRKEQGLSQEALAHAIGVDRSYISSLERSVYSASVDMIEKIAGAFKVDPGALISTKFGKAKAP